jgi:hypothetical protein
MPLKQVRGAYNIHTGTSDFGDSISIQEIDDLEYVSPGPEGLIYFSNAKLVGIKRIEAVDVEADSVTTKLLSADTGTIRDLTVTNLTSEKASITTLQSTVAQIAKATVDELYGTMLDCIRLLAVNIKAAIAEFSQVTAAYADVIDMNAGTLVVRGNASVGGNSSVVGNSSVGGSITVTGDASITGSLTAGNIVSTARTIVADATGFYTWTHRALRPPVAHFAIPEAGEVCRMMNSTNTSLRIFLYTAAPIRLNFLAIGI